MNPHQAAILALALLSCTGAAPQQPDPALYSEQQASVGADLYAAQCAMCHGAHLEGTYEIPALRGKFVANWAQRPVGNLHAYLVRAMPQNAPGTLSSQDSAALIAYILKTNGYAPGTKPLQADPAILRAKIMPKP
jgi:S-disulfanyl-L-cysteine oxidoreductase SoxD